MKSVIMVLASLAVVLLVVVTWALARVSAWIIFHDPVWGQMDKEGAGLEHAIAEFGFEARDFYIPAVMAVVGIGFLVVLWRALPSQPKSDTR